MTKLTCLFVSLFGFNFLFSQKNIFKFPGYVVTINNDTIRAQIIITDHVNNIELSDLFTQVTYLDSTGNKVTAWPEKQLTAFQFLNNGKQYHFEKLLLNKKNEYGFAYRMIHGPVTLYQYARNTELDYFKPTLDRSRRQSGKYTQRYIYYYLKRNEVISFVKTKATLRNVPGSIDKKWLKSYFNDDIELANKIGREIEPFDLETIVNEYNLRKK